LDEDSTSWIVILNRSEGSLGVDQFGVDEDRHVLLPIDTRLSLTPSDPSLRFRMTVRAVLSSSNRLTG